VSIDPRLTLAGPDLAASGVEGVVRSAHFVATMPRRVTASSASLRAAASAGSEQVNQLLFGEVFDALETRGEFVWGQARRDGYVGFVESRQLGADSLAPTHWIKALRAFAFVDASIKSPAVGPLSLNALVTIEEETDVLARAAGMGWIAKAHLAPIGQFLVDPAAVAESFVGAPYLWGGRDGLGVDCSGLVQQALWACGLGCPRDADQQAQTGEAIDRMSLGRRDLVFWSGHVGMMIDSERVVHANAHHMAVAIEPLGEVISRIEANGGGGLTACRRLGPYFAKI
jgi:cell wall-associated NlpC family hydrolase